MAGTSASDEELEVVHDVENGENKRNEAPPGNGASDGQLGVLGDNTEAYEIENERKGFAKLRWHLSERTLGDAAERQTSPRFSARCLHYTD